MIFRTAGAIATLLIGLGASAGDALAQYYPPAQAYPPPQAYPPAQGYRPLPPVADADDNQIYDLQGRPLPPAAAAGLPRAISAARPRAGCGRDASLLRIAQCQSSIASGHSVWAGHRSA